MEGQRQEDTAEQSREGQQQRSDIMQSDSGRWLRFSAGEAPREPDKNA